VCCVYLCYSSGGGLEDDRSRFILGVVGCFIFFLSNIAGDGTRICFLHPCERVEIYRIPGDVPFVCVAALATDAGLLVCQSTAVDLLFL